MEQRHQQGCLQRARGERENRAGDQQERNVREGGSGMQWSCAGRGSKGCTCIGLKPAVIHFRVSNLLEPIWLNFHLFQVAREA